MPLDPTFWDELSDPAAPPVVVTGFPFKVRGLTNFPAPTRFLRINPGDEMLVSWAPPEVSMATHGPAAPVVVKQRSRGGANVYGLVVGFVPNAAHYVGWLRIRPKLLETLAKAYKDIDPSKHDCIIKRHANSGWQVMVQDDNALEKLRGTGDYLTLTGKIRSLVAEWPGDRVL